MSDAVVRGLAERPARRRPMTDRIVLANMRFQGRHGVHELGAGRRRSPSRSMSSSCCDLQPAGVDDDLEQTDRLRPVYEAVRQIVESTPFNLLEALAEAIAHDCWRTFERRRGRRPHPQARRPARRPTRLRGRRDPAGSGPADGAAGPPAYVARRPRPEVTWSVTRCLPSRARRRYRLARRELGERGVERVLADRCPCR